MGRQLDIGLQRRTLARQLVSVFLCFACGGRSGLTGTTGTSGANSDATATGGTSRSQTSTRASGGDFGAASSSSSIVMTGVAGYPSCEAGKTIVNGACQLPMCDDSFTPFGAVARPVGASPVAVTVGDWNGNGLADLATANRDADSVSVLLGNGDGTFGTALEYATGSEPSSISSVDLNHDQTLDLVTTNRKSDTISVLLGRRDGTFSNRADYPTGPGSQPFANVVGDFNGDRVPDVAIANRGISTVSVMLGNGDGTFSGRIDRRVGDIPESIATADFDRDGRLDLAVAKRGTGAASVLRGKGDGTFGEQVAYETGIRAHFITTADLNQDGLVDLAIVDEGANDGAVVSVLLGLGNGTFAQRIEHRIGSADAPVDFGDVNGDGVLDLVAPAPYGLSFYGSASMAFGRGNGTFLPTRSKIAPFAADFFRFGDFNRDGILDLVTLNTSESYVLVALGLGDGTFFNGQASATGQVEQGDSSSLQLEDLNHDGKLDIVMTAGTKNVVAVLVGAGDGSFQLNAEYPTSQFAFYLEMADVNGDSELDLIFGTEATLRILLGNGDATFRPGIDTPGSNPILQMRLGDLNGDGSQDIVVAYQTTPSTFDYSLGVQLGLGDGTFDAPLEVPFQSHWVADMVLADIDGDSKLDVVVAGDTISVLRGNGDGTFSPGTSYAPEGTYTTVMVGDFNSDSRADLLASSTAWAPTPTTSLMLRLGALDDTFSPPIDYFFWGNSAEDLKLADLNKDGKLDVILVNGSIGLLFGTGSGTFDCAQRYIGVGDADSVDIGDVNGDGRPDLVTSSRGDIVTAYLNRQ